MVTDEENPPVSRASSSFSHAEAPQPPPLPPATIPAPPFPPSSKESASASASSAATGQRQRFFIELRPGETTIVSWKRLLRDSNKAVRSPPVPDPPPSGAHPALESRLAPAGVEKAAEGESKDAPASNRFSAVIEKIERLYMGKQSSDEEELDGVPDDDEYDTDDSFIDDAELDEYFEVDEQATKHNGFFVNRGKLEKINEPNLSPNRTSRKRRRKDVSKTQNEIDGELATKKHAKTGNTRVKASAKNIPAAGNMSAGPKISASVREHHQDRKPAQNASAGALKKKKNDSAFPSEHLSAKMPQKNLSISPMETKDGEKYKGNIMQQKDAPSKRIKNESLDDARQIFYEKGASIQDDPQSRRLLDDTNGIEPSAKIRHREKNGNEPPDLSSGSKYSMQKVKSASTSGKEGSSVRPKGTMLERAIRELENVVAVSRPPTMEVQDADASSQGVKRRLPRDVKQKLAKVARLAQSSQGKISEELISRLMSILGHIVQLKTLKRNLKAMVQLGLSAKQAKDDRFQQIKKEVVEMIKTRHGFLMSKVTEHQDGSSDDFQKAHGLEEKAIMKSKYRIDPAIEDKICDLYDLYFEGMDEDKGPRSRKLYVELAELWPNGFMDNLGIKTAVYRAKERKKAHMRHKEAQKIKRRKPTPVVRMEESSAGGEASSIAQVRAVQERQTTETSSQAFMSADRPVSNHMATNQLPVSSSLASTPQTSDADQSKPDKARGSTSMLAVETGRTNDATFAKKKLKRKPESGFADGGVQSLKSSLSSQQSYGKERHKSDKPPAGNNRSSLQTTGLSGSEQPS